MTQSTTDIWLASFLISVGKEMTDYNKKQNGRFEFIFGDISDAEWKSLKLQFKKSDVIKLKYIQEQLKDVIYG